jgi:hypothetical protein
MSSREAGKEGGMTDLIERLKAQAKVHSDLASQMWRDYHTTANRRRAPLPWMCRQEEDRASTLTEAAEALSQAQAEVGRLREAWEEQTRQLLALRMARPTLDDLRLLSRVFHASGKADIDQTHRINDWLKAHIADADGSARSAERRSEMNLTDAQRELLEDKFVLWVRASRDGAIDFRDYNRRAAEALKVALCICAEASPPPPQEDR